MAYYELNVPQPRRDRRAMLVMPPLFITLLFCYGFVLMQPHRTKDVSNASTSTSSSAAQPSSIPASTFAKQNNLETVVDTATTQASSNSLTNLQNANSSGGEGVKIQVNKSNMSSNHSAQSLKVQSNRLHY